MKKIVLLFTACIIILSAKAQTEDSTYTKHEQQIIELQNDINKLQENYEQSMKSIQIDLINFNKQFRGGTSVILLGVTTMIAGVLVTKYSPELDDLITGLTIGGAALTLVGGIIQIDSFKHLGGSQSLTIKMKFHL